MLDELRLRNYADNTAERYLEAANCLFSCPHADKARKMRGRLSGTLRLVVFPPFLFKMVIESVTGHATLTEPDSVSTARLYSRYVNSPSMTM
jgi:hypothetical protein